MSWDLNKVDLVGRLTRDPELKYTPSGTAVASFALAVGGKPKEDKSDNVSFFEITAWGKTAETCQKYLTKGKQIAVMGYLQQQRWVDKDSGKARSKVQVVAERIQFLGSPKDAAPKMAAQPLPMANDTPEPADEAEDFTADDFDNSPSF